jgi:hypothetical protein
VPEKQHSVKENFKKIKKALPSALPLALGNENRKKTA